MAFHELAANAARHGALSVPGGRVRVGWSVERTADGAPAVLDVAWRERGGPPLAGPPERTGFGMRLLERGLAQQLGGVARPVFAPDGFEFDLRLPLSARVEAR
jgi:two-component sensor histidine kinase